MPLNIESLTGQQLAACIPDLAQLRIAVFREYPYLYDGDVDYEAGYLANYARHESSVCVIARDGEQIVGASTAMWLRHADADFQRCFQASDWPLDQLFYFGESVLLPGYRGLGLGHQFMTARETHARALGAVVTGFCAVDRPPDHPARPSGYRDLHGFWRKRGYRHYPDFQVQYRWKELGATAETPHGLSFWLKDWRTG